MLNFIYTLRKYIILLFVDGFLQTDACLSGQLICSAHSHENLTTRGATSRISQEFQCSEMPSQANKLAFTSDLPAHYYGLSVPK
jgi:hypothetical protein